ncbi:sensor histidine kinase [Nocardiopsis ganjiahuensis]|uniref:sensor histidine kinase n=1 Tax=Nocardiopsis ganjiahuensis TaxID=239984 RepID=UPI00034793A2|nr:sensor histidine kinase [Nocardiopsis ganjiahuensis]
MRKNDSLSDPSSWVTLREDRPPRVLNLLFWTAVVTTGMTYGIALATQVEEFPSADPTLNAVIVASVACMALSCALWPLLAWSPSAGWARKAVSVLFLVVSVFALATNNYTVLILVCLATMNSISVFGIAGAFGYAALLGGANLALVLLAPGDPLLIGLVTTGSALILVLVSGLVYVSLVVASQRAERTLELLAELEEAHAELRRHADRVRELTVAEERARMSREMHDSTGHYLTALTMALSNALRFRAARPESAWDEVEQARELAREALTDTRRWVRALRPLQLEGRAGPAAMRAMAESFDGGGAHIVFTGSGIWPELSQEAELVCYRALQEGLTNAMRHSGGDRVEVAVAASPEGVSVTVTDNGSGAEEDAARNGFGLRGLRERVASVDGSVSAESPPGGGFRLGVSVPAAVPAGRAATVAAGGAV